LLSAQIIFEKLNSHVFLHVFINFHNFFRRRIMTATATSKNNTFNIVLRKLDEITPYDRNPRINDAAVDAGKHLSPAPGC